MNEEEIEEMKNKEEIIAQATDNAVFALKYPDLQEWILYWMYDLGMMFSDMDAREVLLLTQKYWKRHDDFPDGVEFPPTKEYLNALIKCNPRDLGLFFLAARGTISMLSENPKATLNKITANALILISKRAYFNYS